MKSQARANTRTLEIIDQVGRDQPFCASCGRPTQPVARDGVMWLECQSWSDPKSPVGRFLSFQAGHTRQQLVDEPASAGTYAN